MTQGHIRQLVSAVVCVIIYDTCLKDVFMRLTVWLALLTAFMLASGPVPAQTPPPAEHARLYRIAGQVQPAQLKATLTRLVGFGTRQTMSVIDSKTRGIGAARRWVKSRFETISQECGGCLEVITPTQTVTGPRIDTPTEIMDVAAIQRGTSDPNRIIIIITAHLDSRVTDVTNKTADAPGADDDGSGTAAVLEAARVLRNTSSPQPWSMRRCPVRSRACMAAS
jgi:hypothetical protein